MRVLFYLPVVTPWWFDTIIVHLIRTIARDLETHVIVPPIWRNTGIGPAQLAPNADLSHVVWHIWDGDDHPLIRTGVDPALIALVNQIDPTLTFCRSADLDAPRHFPGVVRYIMEGNARPLPTPPRSVVFKESPFDHGFMPALPAEQRAALDARFDPIWAWMRAQFHADDKDRASYCAETGLPEDRRILALPLEYEHPENFFAMHRGGRGNAELIAELGEGIGDDFVLAVSNHPLNLLHVDNRAVNAAVGSLGARAHLMPSDKTAAYGVTERLVRHSDGLFLENSKCYAMSGFFGVPMLRDSPFATGGWLNAGERLDAFLADLRAGAAKRPSEADARTWFAYHLANDVLDPRHPDVDAAEILDRVVRPHAPDRWEESFARFDAYCLELLPCRA